MRQEALRHQEVVVMVDLDRFKADCSAAVAELAALPTVGAFKRGTSCAEHCLRVHGSLPPSPSVWEP